MPDDDDVPYDDPGDDFRWPLDRRGWQHYAACAGVRPEVFFVELDDEGTEPTYLTQEQRAHCSGCPVRVDCYEEHRHEEFGVFGGTTGYQRTQLNRRLSRRRCPVCSDVRVVPEDGCELCLSCGHSWRVRSFRELTGESVAG